MISLTFRALALRQRETNAEGPMLETLDYTIRIGSTPTFLYFDLYLSVCLSVYLSTCLQPVPASLPA